MLLLRSPPKRSVLTQSPASYTTRLLDIPTMAATNQPRQVSEPDFFRQVGLDPENEAHMQVYAAAKVCFLDGALNRTNGVLTQIYRPK